MYNRYNLPQLIYTYIKTNFKLYVSVSQYLYFSKLDDPLTKRYVGSMCFDN